MLRHLVVFTLRPGVSHDDPRVPEAVAASRTLGSLPQVSNWVAGRDVSGRDIAADAAATGDFADAAALGAFLAHPDHVAAGRQWAELATWTIVDIELP